MNKQDIWNAITDQNPALDDDNVESVKIKVSSVRKMFDLVWEHAYDAGLEAGQPTSSAEATDLFNNFFGGFNRQK